MKNWKVWTLWIIDTFRNSWGVRVPKIDGCNLRPLGTNKQPTGSGPAAQNEHLESGEQQNTSSQSQVFIIFYNIFWRARKTSQHGMPMSVSDHRVFNMFLFYLFDLFFNQLRSAPIWHRPGLREQEESNTRPIANRINNWVNFQPWNLFIFYQQKPPNWSFAKVAESESLSSPTRCQEWVERMASHSW